VSLAQRFWLTLGVVLVVTVVMLAMFEPQLLKGAGPHPAATTPGTPRALEKGASGVGDPYLPEAGGSGYDVQHYQARVSASAAGEEMRGSTTITAVAGQDLDELHLDLSLVAGTVTVNGATADFRQSGSDLAISATRPAPDTPAIAKASTFTVTIDYRGFPGEAEEPGTSAYNRAGSEFVIAGEPQSAALWYPANDHPRDPATMQFEVSVPRGTEAICAGRLISRDRDPDDTARERWVWQVDAPSVTYASFLGVGDYTVEQGTADGRPFVYAVSRNLSADDQARALRWLRRTPASIAKLETYLGSYPFSGMGGFVPNTEFQWGGLETAMNPVYNKHIVGSETLLNHELAHMWFGDTVTLTEWNDIFNNESLTTYAEWLTTTGSDPADNFRRIYVGQANEDAFWGPPLSDLGVEQMFRRVYDRGPLVVHALRTRIGDDTFWPMFKAWAQQRGPRSLEQFRETADEATPIDLTRFFAEWLDQEDRPEATEENGVSR